MMLRIILDLVVLVLIVAVLAGVILYVFGSMKQWYLRIQFGKARAQIREAIAMLESVAYEVPSRKADVVKLVEQLNLAEDKLDGLESRPATDGTDKTS